MKYGYIKMVTQSSITSYNQGVRDGTIPSQRRRIYNLLMTKGPMTNRMIATVLNIETASISARVNGMLESEIIQPLKEHAPCPHTGKRVRWIEVIWPQQMEMRL
jgi:predicted transcriptional regulator